MIVQKEIAKGLSFICAPVYSLWLLQYLFTDLAAVNNFEGIKFSVQIKVINIVPAPIPVLN